ncbi:hypothetical protein RFI_20934 [Reticulomyxa filosa]|uniref:Uncharacterized protein n=1 Tax=Reticulomyxa filosa TaxID=46433 RepID=X6MSK3_RETFI|nr:hypothetical protein RFI_20934 [Reticulomyxa filosa]|eukprot:ETO16407.1 hypothetical protein RFI_20934 [Reticulomyxa filosa]
MILRIGHFCFIAQNNKQQKLDVNDNEEVTKALASMKGTMRDHSTKLEKLASDVDQLDVRKVSTMAAETQSNLQLIHTLQKDITSLQTQCKSHQHTTNPVDILLYTLFCFSCKREQNNTTDKGSGRSKGFG